MLKNKGFATSFALIIGFALFGSASAHAIAYCPDGTVANSLSECNDASAPDETVHTPVVTSDNDTETPVVTSDDQPSNDDSDNTDNPNNAMVGGGTSDESSDNQTPDKDESNDESSETEDEDAPLWPMIISLAALGVAVLFIIVLNVGKKGRA